MNAPSSPPELHIIVRFEGAPIVSLVVENFDDEQRLRVWLGFRKTRLRVLNAVRAALDAIEVPA